MRRTRRGPENFGGQSWSGLVVVASSTSWDDNWLSEKHLALHLSSLVPVLFVDPPVSVLTPLRKPGLKASLRGPRLRKLRPNLARLTPLSVPGISRPGPREIGEWATRRAIRRAVRILGSEATAMLATSLDPVFAARPEAISIVYGTDDWSASAALIGVSHRRIQRREKRQLAQADVVVAVTEQLAERWRAQGHEVVVIPNGCDTERFAASDDATPAPEVTLPTPIAGFIGHLSERIELAALEAIAASGASLLLVGPRQLTFNLERMSALFALSNVQWVGPQPFERLPEFMRHITVGLTPYTDSDFNLSSDPLKTLEYLAAGRPAVVSALPSALLLPQGLVEVAPDPRTFAELTVAALLRPPDPSAAERRKAYAQGQSWDARAADFLLAIRGHAT